MGKSVALADLAAELCGRDDISALQIVFVPCDGMSARDLRRTFTIGRELTRSANTTGSRRIWLLDEISAIDGWTSIVKAARDGTEVGDDTLVLTGSRWRSGEDVEGNLLAGRAGTTNLRRVRHLLPMSFRSFLTSVRPELTLPSTCHPSDLQSSEVRRGLEVLRFDVDAYDLAWQTYLTCGGFPRAVAEHHTDGAVSDGYLRDLAAWLRGDVNLDGPPESLALLLDALCTRVASPLNVSKLAESLGWTRSVTEGRVNRLVASFAALWCRQHGSDLRVVAGAQSKLYLVDPLLAWLPGRLRAGLAVPDMTRLTEQALAVALARRIDELDEGRWIAGDTLGYVRTGSGAKVDFGPLHVPADGGVRRTVPIESKWVDGGWRGESRVIEGKYGEGIVATKSVLDVDRDVWAVPAPLLALLLG